MGALTLASTLPWQPALGAGGIETSDAIAYAPNLRELKPDMHVLNTLKARLNANENPYGPSPKALEALRAFAHEGNRYSWMQLRELIDKLAEKEGVTNKHVMMGPGSSDLLEKTALVNFMGGGGNIVSGDPPYMSMVSVAKAVGGTWKPVKLTADYQHDLAAMEAAVDANTKVVYITNPNNPTGTVTNADALRGFCERVSKKTLVFVDEAYIELSDNGMKDSMVGLVAQGHNIMVARTFSKIHGMAGIRVGYAVGNEETLAKMQAITRGGMGIARPSIAAAMASLDDLEFQQMSKEKIAEGRKFTCDFLDSMGLAYMPSQTNFVIFPLEGMEGKAYMEAMQAKGVGLRVFEFWDKTWSRVSIGTMDEMKIFAEALKQTIG